MSKGFVRIIPGKKEERTITVRDSGKSRKKQLQVIVSWRAVSLENGREIVAPLPSKKMVIKAAKAAGYSIERPLEDDTIAAEMIKQEQEEWNDQTG